MLNQNIPQYLTILLLFLLSLFLFGSCQLCTPGGERKVDGLVAKLITIGNSGRRFPEDKGPELRKYCSENKIYAKNIEDYKNKCMKGLSKQVSSFLLYSLKNALKQLCNKDSRKVDRLIASTKCINTATPEINKCYTNLIDSILGIANAQHNKKIPHVCCEYYRAIQCIENRSKRIPVCTEQHITFVMDFIRSMLGSVNDLICADYTEGSDKCEILGRPPNKTNTQRRTKSFLLPLVKLFDSFPEI